MERSRIDPLDDICVSISECRGQMNDLRAEESGLEQSALGLMRRHNKTSWKHANVELIRVPGEEKLRVRTSRTHATAEVQEGEGDTLPAHDFDDDGRIDDAGDGDAGEDLAAEG
jgi:hypothetical protein